MSTTNVTRGAINAVSHSLYSAAGVAKSCVMISCEEEYADSSLVSAVANEVAVFWETSADPAKMLEFLSVADICGHSAKGLHTAIIKAATNVVIRGCEMTNAKVYDIDRFSELFDVAARNGFDISSSFSAPLAYTTGAVFASSSEVDAALNAWLNAKLARRSPYDIDIAESLLNLARCRSQTTRAFHHLVCAAMQKTRYSCSEAASAIIDANVTIGPKTRAHISSLLRDIIRECLPTNYVVAMLGL